MSKNEAGGTRERGEPSTGRARMSRRRFLALGAGGASVVALGALGASRRGLLSEKNQERLAGNLAWARGAHLTLEERVRERFHYLRLDPEGVRAFARDFEGRNGPVHRFQRPKVDPFEQFLLSTDFFQNGGDETRTIRYVALYDPYLNPCWNPCNPIA
jgi:hypothetical protein